MKNLSLALNVIMAVAIAVLFYLHSNLAAEVAGTTGANSVDSTAASAMAETDPSFRFAYVNLDTLNTHYLMIRDIEEEVIAERTRMENILKRDRDALAEKVAGFERRAASMSQYSIEAAQAEVAQDQQALLQKTERYERDLQTFELRKSAELNDSLEEFMEEYNADKNYQLILGQDSKFNFLLSADSTLDVTQAILEGLNAAYTQQQNPEQTQP
ncbi:MAG: OmpH family outer membrane protein [Bacteroidota bacterium]